MYLYRFFPIDVEKLNSKKEISQIFYISLLTIMKLVNFQIIKGRQKLLLVAFV
ncbi:MAG: hypothetical protein QXI09_03610 [Candidatus Aenigmatarchaeota archaeon]